jgi:hypothetical protein
MNRKVRYRLDTRPYPESRKNYFKISPFCRYEICAFSHTSLLNITAEFAEASRDVERHSLFNCYVLPDEYLTEYLINC